MDKICSYNTHDNNCDKHDNKVHELLMLASKLCVPVPLASYSVSVISDGKVIKHMSDYCRSWNRNFYNWVCSFVCYRSLYSSSFGPSYLSIKDTSGAIISSGVWHLYDDGYTTSPYYYDYETNTGFYGPLGSTIGIAVGTGTGQESFEDYTLGSIIPNGTSSGQLAYQESRNPSKTWDPENAQYKVSWKRYFNNNSGGLITVNEICMYARMGLVGSGSIAKYVMVCRDKLTEGIAVPNAAQLLVTYDILTQFPENRS